jgi:hypothetical protein
VATGRKLTLTSSELRELPVSVDLMTAAAALGLGRTKAYELARRGEFPCRLLRVGGTYLVPTAGLLRVLGVDRDAQDPAADQAA